MPDIEITFDDRRVQRGLMAMQRKGSQLHEVFKQLRPVLRNELKRRASEEAGPDGAWAPRAASTLKRLNDRKRSVRLKKGTYGPIRRVKRAPVQTTLGRLPGAVTTRVTPQSLSALSSVPWAGVHNVGGTVGHGAVIPARQFVFMSPTFLKQAERDLVAFVMKGWRSA